MTIGSGAASRRVGCVKPAPQALAGTPRLAALYSGGYEQSAIGAYACLVLAALNQPLPALNVSDDPGEVYAGAGMVIGVAVGVYCGKSVICPAATLVNEAGGQGYEDESDGAMVPAPGPPVM